jgi:hypothetical protein
MKGCARTCILWLVGWAAASYAFYFYFNSLRDFGPPMFWASAIAGLAVVAAIGYALGIGTAYRERKTLLEAMAGAPPADGQWVAVSGTIHSMAALTAPISAKEAVAYEYKIYRHERTGKSTTQVTYFEGKALAPSTIATRHGSIRLLSVPSFTDIANENVPWSDAVEHAKAYVASTEFTMFDTSKERRNAVEEESTDDDGQYRLDRQHKMSEIDLADDFRFEEKRIGQGEQVCAFGLYSRTRGGLIPHPNWANQTRLMRGDAKTVAAQLRSRMVKYTIGIVVFGAIAYGIVWLYQYKAATL